MSSYPFEQLYYIYDAGHRYGEPDSVFVPGRWPTRRVRPKEVPLVTRDELAAKFFVPALVDAALVIVQKAHRLGTYDVLVSLDDFEEPTGFLHLLNYSAAFRLFLSPSMLVAHAEGSREFTPTASFWDRVVGQTQETEKTL